MPVQNKKILWLYTGGTIGMDYSSKGLVPVPGIFAHYLKKFERDELIFKIIEYRPLIDSSAIQIEQWNQLIGDIETHYQDYDAFIIVHGTDTMAYTASILAFTLRNLDKPVVLTGSQLPLVHPRSDGWANLADAVVAACEDDLHEVVIVFDHLLLRGCRARKTDAEAFRGFSSPNFPPLGYFGSTVVWQREWWQHTQEKAFHAVYLDPSVNILMLMLTPGESASVFGQLLAKQQPEGAVILSYGCGNSPESPDFIQGVYKACDAGSLVINLTQVLHGRVKSGEYAASQALMNAGVVSGLDMTPEAALAKLTVLTSELIDPEKAREQIMSNWVGELTL